MIVNAWNRNSIPWWLLLPQGVSAAIMREQMAVTPFDGEIVIVRFKKK